MKLMKRGMIDQLSKFFAFAGFVRRNCKLEFLIVILSVLWKNFEEYFPEENIRLMEYFTESRCSGIAGVIAVIIGIYVTIWSIFATSVSKINAELLKNKVEGQMFFVIGMGLVEAFVTTILCAFVPREIPNYTGITALFTTLTLVSFVKFVILIMMITKMNITFIVQEIDEQSDKFADIRIKLDEIYERTKVSKK